MAMSEVELATVKRDMAGIIRHTLVAARNPEAVQNETPHRHTAVKIRQMIFDQLALWGENGDNEWIISLIKADPEAIDGLKILGWGKVMRHYGIH